jgi:nicotinate-nucleotide adenylyltransferase
VEQTVERIGIFGGTFDPPHVGHLIGAELACERYALDTLLFMTAFVPPHKQHVSRAPAQDRLAMTTLATANNPRFAASDIEITREGTSYTIDTIRELKAKHPNAKLFLFIGMDNLAIFHSWRAADEIKQEATVVVMLRPTHDASALDPSLFESVETLEIPLIGISSSDVRARVRAGLSVKYWIPESVEEYIRTHHLYEQPLGEQHL